MGEGGVIYYSGFAETLYECQGPDDIFINNTALYGDDCSSYKTFSEVETLPHYPGMNASVLWATASFRTVVHQVDVFGNRVLGLENQYYVFGTTTDYAAWGLLPSSVKGNATGYANFSITVKKLKDEPNLEPITLYLSGLASLRNRVDFVVMNCPPSWRTIDRDCIECDFSTYRA